MTLPSEDGKKKNEFTVYQEGFASSTGKGEFFVTLEEGDVLTCTNAITLTIQAGIKFN